MSKKYKKKWYWTYLNTSNQWNVTYMLFDDKEAEAYFTGLFGPKSKYSKIELSEQEVEV